MNTLETIKAFLNIKRFAMAGVSRNPEDFSRNLFKEFLSRGYDVVPVNPNIKNIEGRRCFSRMQDIQPQVSCALLMTSGQTTEDILYDCADTGISLVWIYGIKGNKHVSPNIERICEDTGMKIVPGYCPLMFIPSASFPHKFHGAVWKAIGWYPS